MDDLVGTNDIADRLGYSRGEYVNQLYLDRDVGFPAHLTIINGVYIWAWPDVEAWARANRPNRLDP